MVRGEPRAPQDTGWQIMSHIDTSQYLDDPDNWAIVEFDALCEIQPALEGIRDLPVGSDLQIVRDEHGTRVVDTVTGHEVTSEADEPYVPPMIRQGQILQQVGMRLAADLPDGYDAIEAKIRILGGTGGYSADLVTGDRRAHPTEPRRVPAHGRAPGVGLPSGGRHLVHGHTRRHP